MSRYNALVLYPSYQIVFYDTGREDQILLWTDEQGNNLLHMAASISHTHLIRKMLSTQAIDEIIRALLMGNSSRLIPYYCTKDKDARNLLAWAETQVDCYPLVTPPRAVIFYSDEDRPNAGEERDSLMEILPMFGIVPVVKLNPSQKDIFSIIRENQDGEVSALIVVVMCHGDSGVIRVKDMKMPIDQILRQMNVTSLKDIPKVSMSEALV